MEYMIGCNYWGSKHGIDMWKYWDEESVRRDLKELAKYGVKYMRVFPNWRDFQPIEMLYGGKGERREYRFADDVKIDNEFGIDMEKIKQFETFCDIAAENGIKLVVAIVTGWMSGRLYAPPALAGKNLITDHEALSWEIRFVRGFCRYLKHRPEIVYWDLGNECNNLGPIENPWDGYLWTATIRNSILSEDTSREIMSGMHALQVTVSDQRVNWSIQTQGELTDVLTPHPYPSPTIGGNKEPINRMKTTVLPTSQVEMYRTIGGKPAMMQETGSVNDMIGNEETAAQWMRINLLSGWANGSIGYFWWCAHDQLDIETPPNSWSMCENELGLLKGDYSPKKVALTMREVQNAISNMPFGELPKRTEIDAVMIVPSGWQQYFQICSSAYIMGKQAGLNIGFCYESDKLPDVPLYIYPNTNYWNSTSMDMLNAVKQKVEKGATVLVTTESAYLATCEQFLGLTSYGMQEDRSVKTADFGGYELPFSYGTKFLFKSCGADVLVEDEDGTAIFSCNNYGKGKAYFLNFSLEIFTFDRVGSYTDYPYYKIYEQVAADILAKKPVKKDNPNVGVTIHPFDDKHFVTVAVNYMNTPQNPGIQFPEGAEVKVCYGNADAIEPCSATVYEVKIK